MSSPSIETEPPDSEPPDSSEPLGVGATVLSSVFAFLVGGVVGVITTFTYHQALPWALIAGLLVVVALVAGFRLVFDSRIIAGAAALGVVAGIVVLALPGAGGTVLVLSDPAGWIWAVGPTVLAVVVLALPRLRSR